MKIIHVAQCSMVGGLISQSSVDSYCVIAQPDSLSFGPICELAQWTKQRRLFWQEVCSLLSNFELPYDNLTWLINCKTDLEEADEIVIWVGSSLDEQLTFVWIITALKYLGIETERVQCLEVYHNPITRKPLSALSLLPDDGFDFVKNQRRRLTSKELGFIEQAWAVMVSDSPKSLNIFLKTDFGVLPILHQRVCELANRYPDSANGLSQFDSFILHSCKDHGPGAVYILVGVIDKTMNDSHHVGDLLIKCRLLQMASNDLNKPLVKITGTVGDLKSMSVKLTDTALSVLAGAENNVEINGINEWVGGVYLSLSTGNVWFRDSVSGELIK